jgi:hypothetical protein
VQDSLLFFHPLSPVAATSTMGSFFQSFTASTLCLSLLLTGINAELINRQALSPPATLPNGWLYKGCYTYDLLYPSLITAQGMTVALVSLTDQNTGTRSGKDPYKLPHLLVVVRVRKSALNTATPQATV